ncbi:hypothetical protein N0B44_27905 [Roseibacterium beibuensis]|uniref:DoxX family protein n=1 Tax=[Roseibacterium] beibuensis TaxID=1193142 RepID=A0ABP9LR22_9RHOB|nr:hypothetical protein [Roseibacterium beibuensis]MCS6626749.1 hypothetical protein [Roseibacterium beibuensis]
MKTIEGTVCLLARLSLGLSYIGLAALEVIGIEPIDGYQFFHLQPSIAAELFNDLGMILLAVVASWLILGIRTRITALLGLALMLATAWSNQYLQTSSAWAVYASSAVLMTVPLLLCGGGHYALVRRGWHGLV